MAKPKSSKDSSEREKWNKIFKNLYLTLHLQQNQLQFLEDRWLSEVNSYKQQISQMEKAFTIYAMERNVDNAKAEFAVGLKHRDAVIFKKKFEDADSELADFREWFDYLSHKCSQPNDLLGDATTEKAETRAKAWESKLRRLRSENEKLTSDKNTEISALLSEKKFIWNQFNKLEHDMTEQLRRKNTEIENANEKIQAFEKNFKELESSNTNKDNTIATLRTRMATLESECVRKSEEISRLSAELELLRKSGSASVTPVLRSHSAGSGGPSKLRGTSSGTDQKNILVKKASHSVQALEKGLRSSKRKAGDSIAGVPKLFTSSFKVPKLKSSSPCVVT